MERIRNFHVFSVEEQKRTVTSTPSAVFSMAQEALWRFRIIRTR